MQIDFDRNVPFDLERSLDAWLVEWRHPAILLRGLPFSLTLLVILLAHEFGHYMAAVFHRVDASLPYFLPSPFLGTFGAFIRVRSPIYSKRALFDIGIAGPLAGFVFLAPALAIGAERVGPSPVATVVAPLPSMWKTVAWISGAGRF